jgi:hypothetical protein
MVWVFVSYVFSVVVGGVWIGVLFLPLLGGVVYILDEMYHLIHFSSTFEPPSNNKSSRRLRNRRTGPYQPSYQG